MSTDPAPVPDVGAQLAALLEESAFRWEAIDPAWQARVARANGLRAVEVDAGHSPFFTQPEELAELLHELA